MAKSQRKIFATYKPYRQASFCKSFRFAKALARDKGH